MKAIEETSPVSESLCVDEARTRAPLRECVRDALEHYLTQLDGHPAAALYELVLQEVERPMLETVMEHVGGNQSRAAEVLGINRGTLRKKLRHYELL
jgi:Fis family transcriptional regulator